MKVYTICWYKKDKTILDFENTLLEQLQNYGISVGTITNINYRFWEGKIQKHDIVIIYNQEIQSENIEFSKLIKKLERKNVNIWPVALEKNRRKPEKNIALYQSYDVWEQLRCRDLDESYIPFVAKIFSRKILSKVCPVLYSEAGEVFLSHRRIDGEDITAKIYDKMVTLARTTTPFRDVVNVEVGEEAQAVIDENMQKSDVFVFIHTPKAQESEWVLKELRFAVLRNIPILWIQIDNADIKGIKIKPSDRPHLSYDSVEFNNDKTCSRIIDEILDKAFELVMKRSGQTIDDAEGLIEFLGSKVEKYSMEKMIYHISAERKGYRYPQRKIEQYFQIYGRTPNETDIENLKLELEAKTKDSIVILTNKKYKSSIQNGIVVDSIDNFFYAWRQYECGAMKCENENMEIVLSGAFPDAEEIYKQSLTDALVLFIKEILRRNYKIAFGAHPTFQELFFEIAKEEFPNDYNKKIKMYISDYYRCNENERQNYEKNCKVFFTQDMGGESLSLTTMRRQMIQRKSVKALVCLGGKIKKNPCQEGIREEVELAREYNIPVFIVGSVGGCSSRLAEEYEKIGWEKINGATKELNEEFFQGLNYRKMVQDMLTYIENSN